MKQLLIDPSHAAEDLKPLYPSAGRKMPYLGLSRGLLRVVGLGIPLILLCAPTIRDLWDMWWSMHGVGHGFFLLLISVYLAWFQGQVLRDTPVAPALGSGALWLMIAILLLIVSQTGGVITLGGVALVLVLAGLVLLLGGSGYLKAMVFPLTYLLIFMTPVLSSLIESLKWPFQILTARMSVSMLEALGIPVFLENSSYIVLPTVKLNVAQECSGVGIFIAVLAIALPLAYVILRARWSRITLVISSLMVAIAVNWLRVTVMGVYAQWGGKELHGPYHILGGLFLDSLAFAYLFAGAWFLGRLESVGPAPALPRKPESSGGYDAPAQASRHAWWLGSFTCAMAVLLLYSLDSGAPALKKDLATFPEVIGDWVVDRAYNNESIIPILSADDSLVRTYLAPDGRRVQLYIAHLSAQRQGKELVGPATAPLHEMATPAELRVGSIPLPVNRTFIRTTHQDIPAIFSYHIDGMSYANRYMAKLATIKQAFLHGRTDGTLVLVAAEPQTDIRKGQWDAEEQFAGAVLTLLQDYLP